MNLYEEIELQEKERIVDSLATENQRLQEPKIPTKEQIEQLAHTLPWEVLHLLPNTNKDKLIIAIIKTWEKIRNS